MNAHSISRSTQYNDTSRYLLCLLRPPLDAVLPIISRHRMVFSFLMVVVMNIRERRKGTGDLGLVEMRPYSPGFLALLRLFRSRERGRSIANGRRRQALPGNPPGTHACVEFFKGVKRSEQRGRKGDDGN